MKDAHRLKLIAQALERGIPPKGYCSALRDIAERLEFAAVGLPVSRDIEPGASDTITPKTQWRTFEELNARFDGMPESMQWHQLTKDAKSLEVIIAQVIQAGSLPSGYGLVLRDIAQRLEGAASGVPPTDYVVPSMRDPEPTVDDIREAVKAELDSMAHACEDCRAALAGKPSAHKCDIILHFLARHGERLAELMDLLCDDELKWSCRSTT